MSALSSPDSFSGDFVTSAGELPRWAGASGPFWLAPEAVAVPRSREDVVSLVRWAAARDAALVPRGGGSGMPGGNVGPDVVVDLTELADLDFLPGSAAHPGPTLRCGAGAVAARARGLAREHGLDLPALPSSAPWCTAGGIVACNAAGARSFQHGSARSWVRAVEWVRADGSVETLRRGQGNRGDWAELRAAVDRLLPDPLPWPDVRKNSSGYALDAWTRSGDALDLVLGSEGTLGIITAVDLVPSRPPRERRLVLAGVPTLARLPELARAAGRLPTAHACEYLGRQLVAYGGLAERSDLAEIRLDFGLVLFELAGDPDRVTADTEAVVRLAAAGGTRVAVDPDEIEALWSLRHAASPTLARALEEGRRSTQFIEDSVVPLDALPAYIRGLEEILHRHETEFVLFGHLGDGNLHVNPLVDLSDPLWRDRVRSTLDAVVELVAGLGGTLAGEHGDGRLRTPFLPRLFHPRVIRAFQLIKETLDPLGILNPDVVVPTRRGVDPLAGLGSAPAFASGSQGPERGQR